jgi:hypothetical protein
MTDLYKEVILELEKRKGAHVRDIAPFYISSMATHVFNLTNQKKRILTDGGLPANVRQHIMYVAPPGFGKSYFVKQMLEHEDYSIVKGVNAFPCMFEGSMTEAGLIGTIQAGKPGEGAKRNYGLAGGDGINAIVGMEEFAAITNAMVQEFNAGLDTSLLTSLDSGIVNKRLANGELKYQTNYTLWAGVQPARYDLSSGLARRFIFITYYPKWSDFHEMKLRRRSAKNIKRTPESMKTLHGLLDQRFHSIRNDVKNVTFHDDFYKILDKKKIIHYEEMLYERLALGYWLMREGISPNIEIRADPELERIILKEHTYRKSIKKGAVSTVVWNLIKDMKTIGRKELKDQLLELSMDYDESSSIINNLIRMKYVAVNQDTDTLVILKK